MQFIVYWNGGLLISAGPWYSLSSVISTAMSYFFAISLNASKSFAKSSSLTGRRNAFAVQILSFVLPSILLKVQVVPISPPACALIFGITFLIIPPKSQRFERSIFIGNARYGAMCLNMASTCGLIFRMKISFDIISLINDDILSTVVACAPAVREAWALPAVAVHFK